MVLGPVSSTPLGADKLSEAQGCSPRLLNLLLGQEQPPLSPTLMTYPRPSSEPGSMDPADAKTQGRL